MYSKLLLFSFLTSVVLGITQVHAQSPTAVAKGFNVFSKGNFTTRTNEVEGPVAVGGNMFVNGTYNIKFDKTKGAFYRDGISIGLAIRGGLKLGGPLKVDLGNYAKIGVGTPNSADLTNLKVWYKDRNGHVPGGALRITEENAGFDGNPNFIINTGPSEFKPGYTVNETYNPVIENVFGTASDQIDIDGAFLELIRQSNSLKSLTNNVQIYTENHVAIPASADGSYTDPSKIGQNPRLKFKSDEVNVLTVSAAVWNSINNFNFDNLPSTTPLGMTAEEYANAGRKFALIVNIIDFPTFCYGNGGDPSINFPNMGGLDKNAPNGGDDRAGMILFNFPDATKKVTLKKSVIFGTILAPQAYVIKNNDGNLTGQVISNGFEHNGHEIHWRPFLPSVTPPVTKAITAEVSTKCFNNAPYLDYTVTGNFDLTGKSVKISWENSSAQVVEETSGLGLTGSILFPGAAIDGDGNGIAWPGFKKEGDKWVEDPTDRNGTLRASGAKVNVTVDGAAPFIANITFPVSHEGCYTNPTEIPEPVVNKIEVEVSTKCYNNAPYLTYTITGNYDLTGKTATILFKNGEDLPVDTYLGQALAGDVLFPGAGVDETGNGNAWPGYKFDGKKWIENESDINGTLRLGGANVYVTVEGAETFVAPITFPGSVEGCLTTPPPGSTLPVTLSSFTASKENCDVKLKWVVSEAKDFSHFVVERSSDAKTFSQVARINYNASQNTYSFAESPFSSESTPSKSYYYRLQQVDVDETFDYSSIRVVETGSCDARLAVDFYPNPTQESVNVKSFSPLKKVEIFTLGGKQMFETVPGNNQTEVKINVQSYAQGLYILKVVNAEGQYTSKILKK